MEVDFRIDTGSVNLTTSSFPFTANTVGNLIDLVDVSPVASAVPEPASMTLLGFGVAGLFGDRARR